VRFPRLRLWPRSLAARTATVLLTGLIIVQVAGLTIHALDRIDLQQFVQLREVAGAILTVTRSVAMTPPADRPAVLAHLPHGPTVVATWSSGPPVTQLPEMPLEVVRRFWTAIEAGPMTRADPRLLGGRPLSVPERMAWATSDFMRRGFGQPENVPTRIVAHGGLRWRQLIIGVRFGENEWLNFSANLDPPSPWHSRTFLVAFGLMTVVAAGLTLWAVRRLTAPVRTLAAAADALGRDVNAAPLPESGPLEIAAAAVAFNTMASRIRRFVEDRTTLLTAIGHDLRTPITRMKLRAEFLDDDEVRSKLLADLAELEAMVSATLAFGRDARTTEKIVPLDLAELIRTILDEAGDTHLEAADRLGYDGPTHLTIRARSLAMKRALTNLISNAIAYGGSARVRLEPPAGGRIVITVEDDGPGIPIGELERVFEPFHRVEGSRNRETGGTGLGLPIARDIIRAHGGDITLANRRSGGLAASVVLPA
jgi:signal transduction histidine kinase